MVSIADLIEDQRTVNVQFPKSELRVVYRPSAFNAKLEKEERDSLNNRELFGMFAKSMAMLLVEWDLTDTKGKTIPLTPDALSEVGLPILRTIRDAIYADYVPNFMNVNNLQPTSSLADEADQPQNG